jgi:hypothetical protein
LIRARGARLDRVDLNLLFIFDRLSDAGGILTRI